MPRSEGIETFSNSDLKAINFGPRNECPDQRGLKLFGASQIPAQPFSSERMPRSEGIETVEATYHLPRAYARNECPDQRGLKHNKADANMLQHFPSERMPRSEGIETLSPPKVRQLRACLGTNAPIRGD